MRTPGAGIRLEGQEPLPPDVNLTEGLTQEEAVAVALWNSPTFQATLVDSASPGPSPPPMPRDRVKVADVLRLGGFGVSCELTEVGRDMLVRRQRGDEGGCVDDGR